METVYRGPAPIDSKLYTGSRKANDKENNKAATTKLKSGRLTGILWRFGIKFAARWPR